MTPCRHDSLKVSHWAQKFFALLFTEIICPTLTFQNAKTTLVVSEGQTQRKFSLREQTLLKHNRLRIRSCKNWREQLKSMTIFSFLPRVACPVNRLHSDACSARTPLGELAAQLGPQLLCVGRAPFLHWCFLNFHLRLVGEASLLQAKPQLQYSSA